jgi:hypothetical protein
LHSNSNPPRIRIKEVNPMPEVTRTVPRRIFRVTFTTADGIKRWRYVRCPYQIKSPEDWADSLVGMQTRLAELVLEGRLERFTVSAVAPERVRTAAERTVRWHEVLETIAA